MTWFVRNIVIPRTEIIDSPGFIVLKLSEKGKKTYLRELFFPEGALVAIEEEVIKKYGEDGKKALYSAGKRFGYRFALTSNYPQIAKNSQKEIKSFLYMFLRYMESTYAHKLEYSVDFSKTIYTMIMDNYIVCNKNGSGLILTDGGSAGVWAYMADDLSIEGVQTKCQGRGDKKCEVVCAPLKLLCKQYEHVYSATNVGNLELAGKYEKYNEIRKTTYSQESLKRLIDVGFFVSKEGKIIRNEERYFLCEATLPYILEDVVCSTLKDEKILFNTSFEFGKAISKKENSKGFNKFITDYMSALGWGDVHIQKEGHYKVVSKFFPWCRFSEGSKFIIYRGLLSGLLSGFVGKKILLTEYKPQKEGPVFSLIVSEK